mmetsp:Transcript_4787/g.8214  ORF Transcript_4787/g.8214 Transcript_4787/m.8214 type:complete len:83 (+) Transcript_4787:1319-1567(+)
MKNGVKIELVELQAGKKYQFSCPSGNFLFNAEAGGVISGDNINGSVQGGKAIFTAGENEFEGYFISQNVIDATMRNKQGQES